MIGGRHGQRADRLWRPYTYPERTMQASLSFEDQCDLVLIYALKSSRGFCVDNRLSRSGKNRANAESWKVGIRLLKPSSER